MQNYMTSGFNIPAVNTEASVLMLGLASYILYVYRYYSAEINSKISNIFGSIGWAVGRNAWIKKSVLRRKNPLLI